MCRSKNIRTKLYGKPPNIFLYFSLNTQSRKRHHKIDMNVINSNLKSDIDGNTITYFLLDRQIKPHYFMEFSNTEFNRQR